MAAGQYMRNSITVYGSTWHYMALHFAVYHGLWQYMAVTVQELARAAVRAAAPRLRTRPSAARETKQRGRAERGALDAGKGLRGKALDGQCNASVPACGSEEPISRRWGCHLPEMGCSRNLRGPAGAFLPSRTRALAARAPPSR